MNQTEFKGLNGDFEEEIMERCKKEGITCQVVHKQMDSFTSAEVTVYALNNEAYSLTNTGDRASWKFEGFINGEQQ